jgi:plastocyanin
MRRCLGRFSISALAVVAGLAAAVLLVAGAASGASSRARVGQQTFTVNVDGANRSANESFLSYFPSVVRVHAGDTVVFHEVGNGEPHTVTLGTLADGAVAAFEKLTPKQQQQAPPASLLRLDAKVPFLFPQGPGDAIQSAANPCFLDKGVPSSKALCAKVAQPDFTGQQAYYNSGWLASKQKFTVHLSSATAPGTYRFMCALHREGMTGKIVVAPSGSAVPSASAQLAAGHRQLAVTEAKLAPAVKAERQGKPPIPGLTLPGKTVALAGSGSPVVNEASIDEFGPKVIKVHVGGSVTWYLLGGHTITFNASKTDNDIRATSADGSVHLNTKAVAPANGPGEPHSASGNQGGGPSNGPIKFKVVAATTWNGRGFHNSGLFLNSFPPSIEGYKITFNRAGTYKYICTVHDNMKGTVIVG